MGYTIAEASGARASAVRSPFPRRALPPGWLLAPLLLLVLLLAACSGGNQAVNGPPPTEDPASQPADQLTGAGPSGVTTGPTIQGVLWSDSDGNGVFSLGDSVVGNATVVLEFEGGESFTVSTDEVGQYRITGLEPGASFTLRHLLPFGAAPLSAQAAARNSAPVEQIVKHHVWQ